MQGTKHGRYLLRIFIKVHEISLTASLQTLNFAHLSIPRHFHLCPHCDGHEPGSRGRMRTSDSDTRRWRRLGAAPPLSPGKSEQIFKLSFKWPNVQYRNNPIMDTKYNIKWDQTFGSLLAATASGQVSSYLSVTNVE